MEKIVLALGGSIIAPPGEPDPHAMVQWTEAIKEWSQDHQVLIVVGGGAPARAAITMARHAARVEDDLDLIGIAATRMNANVLLAFLKGNGVDANFHVPRTTDTAVRLANENEVVVMGGTKPGHSTDFVAAELAKKIGAARLVVVSNVDGVYTADPNKDENAQYLESTTFDELLKIVGGARWKQAGSPGIIDGPAVNLLRKSKTPTCVVSGRNLTNIGNAIRGEAFEGTLVTAEAQVPA